jgi:hypothetical protein
LGAGRRNPDQQAHEFFPKVMFFLLSPLHLAESRSL